MNNTQKALINQDVCEQTTPNLGITQSSGLDRHCIYARQRVDEFKDGEVVSTQSARQHKDATDLVCQPSVYGQSQFGGYQEGVSTLRASGRDHGGGSENLAVAAIQETPQLIRRLTPLECERLQGFPDGWTDIPGASDSARYKALGNSVYLIMVVMRRTDVKTAPGEDSWRSCFT